ncbi:hypothetical protein R1flu_009875 [Riccia fluitans]|uniref:FLYWCH-type domain-containing protein n=1 Tax=Riccia fluitans TaxID=41844 RepID=A0ABD1Z480_9MARC
MAQISYFQTSRNGDGLSYEGFSYRKDRLSVRGTQLWRCIRQGCPGRVETGDLPNPIARGRGHEHLPNPDESSIRTSLTRLRDRAVAGNISIPQIYEEEANTLVSSQAASATLPVFRNVASTLYRARRRVLSPLPQTREDIVIPPSL